MSCIHFKFNNTVDNDKIKFNGLQMSVADLKDAIIKQKNLKANLYTLKIIDSQSKKEYSDDKEMVPRNTSVTVIRVPLAANQRIPKARHRDPTLPQSLFLVTSSGDLPMRMMMSLMLRTILALAQIKDLVSTAKSVTLPSTSTLGEANSDRMLTAEELKKTADLVNANATEEDKVKAMISQSGEGYDPSQYVWTPRANPSVPGIMPGLKKNPPPPNYICYRCGNRGHWIQLCPTNGDPNYNCYKFKKAMGTPASQIVSVTENIPGAMLDRHGQLVVRAVDLKAVQDFKMKNKNPPAEKVPKEAEPPPELICSICKKLMKEAVIIPCCGESYCYGCIQEYLCENEFTCPACKKEGISPDNLAPNKALRKSAVNFQMKAAEDKSIAMASNTGFVKQAPILMPPPPRVPSPPNKSTPSPKMTSTVAADTKPTESVKSIKTVEKKEGGVAEASTEGQGSKDTADSATSAVAAAAAPPIVSAASVVDTSSSSLAVARTETLSKSRSGSPANVASPAAITRPLHVTPDHPATIAPAAKHTRGILPGGVPLPSSLLGQTLGTGHHPLLQQVLGLPAGLQPGILPGQPSLPQPASLLGTTGTTSSDPSKLDKLAAELLLSSAVSKKRASPSPPPPLSIEEFYRQQKLLKKHIARQQDSTSSKSYSSGYSSSEGSTGYSRSPSPYHRSKHSRKRKHEWKDSKHSKSSKRKKESSRERRGKGHESSSSKGRRKRHHGKHKRHDTPSSEESALEELKSSQQQERSGSKSPQMKLSLEELAHSKLPSTDPSTSNTPSEEVVGSLVMEQQQHHRLSPSPASQGAVGRDSREESSSLLSSHRYKHKKKSKKKHKHRRDDDDARSDREEEIIHREKEAGTENGTLSAETEWCSIPVPDGAEDASPREKNTLKEEKGEEEEGQEKLEAMKTGEEVKVEVKEVKVEVDPAVNLETQTDASPSPADEKQQELQEGGEGGAMRSGEEKSDSQQPQAETETTPPKESGDDVTEGVVNNDTMVTAAAEEEPAEEIAVHADDDVGTLDPVLEEKREEDKKNQTVVTKEPAERSLEKSPPPLTKADLAPILDQLESVVDWRSLGLELRVPARKLSAIQQKFPVDSLEQVILLWLQSNSSSGEKCSWKALSSALKRIGESSIARRINKKYLLSTGRTGGKEEGEISDSEEDGQKNGNSLPDLRETLSSLQQNEPDLRETINSHKSMVNSSSRKRPLLDQQRSSSDEGEVEEEDVSPSTKRFKKSAGGAGGGAAGGSQVQSIASGFFTRNMESSESEDDSFSSSSSESEDEDYKKVAKKRRRPSKSDKHSSSSKLKKHRKSREDKHWNKDRDRASKREKKSKKKHKHSSREHKNLSSSSKSHKAKKSSKSDRHKLKKHKKSSSHSGVYY